MALLQSIMIPLGTPMPDFNLKDPFGKEFKTQGLHDSRGLLVGFFCNHCPYAMAVWPRFIRVANYAKNMLKIDTIAINSNIHPDFPEDAPEKMIEKISEWNIPFPYLVDENQDVARLFKAQCTPDIFLFSRERALVYHGRIDDNWQDESKVTREELKEALTNYITGQPLAKDQKPCMGCSIKWRRP